MGKKNKLYPNPAGGKFHPAGSSVILVQPIKMEGRIIMIQEPSPVENLYLQIATVESNQAEETLKRIKRFLQQRSEEDLPLIELRNGGIELLHHGFSAIIYSFCAIETYFNSIIERSCPQDEQTFLLDKLDLQGKIDHMSKFLSVEHIKTAQPKIRDAFSEMEDMRHKIIHSKRDYFFEEGSDWSRLLLSKIFNNKFSMSVNTATSIIDYYRLLLNPIRGSEEIVLNVIVPTLQSSSVKS